MALQSELMSARRYTSSEEDSGRWDALTFRPGDIVVSSRSTHGTTWVQTIVLHLIHGPHLPVSLAELSPWLDHLVEPLDEVVARLDGQPHRRVVKTHTPLDGLPLSPLAHYLVVARDPLDSAVSLYYQGDNIDRERLSSLTDATAEPRARAPIEHWLRTWIDADADPLADLDSLPGVLHHLADAWARRDQPNVTLIHFDDLLADLESQMRRLADLLHLPVDPAEWDELVNAATFERMRARAGHLVPDRLGVLRSAAAFFRLGVSGTGRSLLDAEALWRYDERIATLAPRDLLDWLHRPTEKR